MARGWTVHHQLGHVEKRKKYRWKDPWTMAEWGNWVADGIAGRARKMAQMAEKDEEQEWVALVERHMECGGGSARSE
jgi:hypothetical protein